MTVLERIEKARAEKPLHFTLIDPDRQAQLCGASEREAIRLKPEGKRGRIFS